MLRDTAAVGLAVEKLRLWRVGDLPPPCYRAVRHIDEYRAEPRGLDIALDLVPGRRLLDDRMARQHMKTSGAKTLKLHLDDIIGHRRVRRGEREKAGANRRQ